MMWALATLKACSVETWKVSLSLSITTSAGSSCGGCHDAEVLGAAWLAWLWDAECYLHVSRC